MRRAFFTYLSCMHLALFSPLVYVHAQDIPSAISFVLGGSALTPGPGVDTSSFSWCYTQASFVASIFTSNSPRPTFDPTHLEGIAVGVCTGNSCTGLGFTRLDKCCSIANADHATVAGTGTSAYECLKSIAGGGGGGGGGSGAAQTKPASTTASPTMAGGSSSSSAGRNATLSSSSTTQGGQGATAASPTATPSAATSPPPSSSSSSSSSSGNLGNAQIHDLYSGSAFALLIGLAAYVL